MPSAVAAASEMVLSPIVKSSASSITTSAAAASSSSSSSSSVRLSHFAVSSRRSEPKLQLHRWPTSPVAFKRFATAHLPTSPVQVLKQSFLDDASDDNQSEPEVSTASTTVVVNSPRGSSISTNSSTSRCVTPTHELSISSLWKRRLKSPKDNELADSVHHHLHLHHGHTDLGQQQPLHHVVSSTPERKSLGSTIDLADSRSALAKIRVHVKSIESLVTPNINAPVLTEGLEREAALARASIYEELDEFRHNLEDKVKIFPEYLSTKEKALVKQVAESLRLACQIGESTVSVFKTGPFDNASLHLSSARAAARGRSASESVVNDEVFVDVPSLAQHGKDGFIARLRLRRLNSGGGIRRNMLWDVAETATTDGKADRVSEAGGGVYTVSRSSGETLAMFKPAEEEKFVREGIFPGEGAVREEVAYVLDSRSNGFSGVPATAVARLQVSNAGHARPGAVQRYMMGSIGSMEGFGMPFDLTKATAFVPVEQVHRIALLDIRTFNTDRHPGNILLIGDKAPYTMVPIDHGCILPSWFHLSEARFDWIDYPQCKVPLSESGRAYVEALDANADAQMLRKLGIREECVTTLKICTMLLKIATNAGRSLHWMAGFMQRSGCFENPSDLELVVQQACQLSGIPFSFATNEFGEQKPEIPHGILSRRPPSVFFKHLETLLVDAVRARESV